MILPRSPLRVAVSLAILAGFLTVIFWYIPTFGADFVGQFLSNWVTLVAVFIAAYWATGLEKKVIRK